MANSVDPDDMALISYLIRIYTVCTGIWFGLQDTESVNLAVENMLFLSDQNIFMFSGRDP